MSSSVSLEYLNNRLNLPGVSAQNTSGGSISVLVGGTAVPLSTITYNNGITITGSNTQFRVPSSGNYFVSYQVFSTLSVGIASSVYKNGTSIPNLVFNPGLASRQFSCEAIIPLVQNDVLQLTLYGLLATATLSSGVGAYMIIKKML